MLARKEQESLGKEFPKEWISEVENLLKATYMEEYKDDPRTFSVWGFTYPDEMLLIVSFADNHGTTTSPITLFISVDMDEKTKVKPILSKLLDASGVFFDEVFSSKKQEDPDLYQAHWQEGENNKLKFYFKVSRENIHLSMEATRLLADSGFYTEDDTEDKEQ
jgi:hypothetical protein